MTLLSDSQLEFMRDQIELTLPDTCTILSPTRASDGQGGWTDTWGTASANVKCRLDASKKLAQSERLGGAALLPYSYWMLTLPHDTTIGTTYRVVHSGQTYNVEYEDSEKSWNACVRVLVTRI
jgi:hypothetical protein